jgi:hypothetical protein
MHCANFPRHLGRQINRCLIAHPDGADTIELAHWAAAFDICAILFLDCCLFGFTTGRSDLSFVGVLSMVGMPSLPPPKFKWPGGFGPGGFGCLTDSQPDDVVIVRLANNREGRRSCGAR